MRSAIAWFAGNPVAANLLMLFVVGAGWLSATSVRQETFPNVAFDVVSVTVAYPGATPAEVEESLCVRIEEAIHGTPGVDRLFSSASEGHGAVWAQLAVGADARRATEEIRTRVDALDSLPDRAEEPVVVELIDDSVLLALAIRGHVDERTLRSVGERVRDEISALPEVNRAELVGARPYELAIELSQTALRRHGLSFDDVVASVRGSSLDLPGGALKTSAGEILMRAQGQAYRGPEFERLVLLARDDGTRIRLGEVARVVDGFAESDEKVRIDGEPGVVVRLFTSEPEDVLDVSRAVRDYVASARAGLPEGVSLGFVYDESIAFESRRDLLLRSGAQGLALILLVLALFLRPRLAFWVSFGIPISFLGALIVLALAGVSVNMMSLFAFIVALGLVVDDAIIIGENVGRHQRAGSGALAASITGATEVATPVVVAVLTTLLFVAPTLALPTFIGKIAQSLGVVVIGCLVFSLVEALWILPAHLAHAPGGGEAAPRAPRGWGRVSARVDAAVERFIVRRYVPFLRGALRERWLALSLAAVMLMLAFASIGGGWIRYDFFPDVEIDAVDARLEMPEGTPPERMEAALAGIEREALRLREALDTESGRRERGEPSVVESVMVWIGDSPLEHDDFKGGGVGPNVGRVRLGLVPGEQRRVSSLEIEERWRARVDPIPGAVSLAFSGDEFGGEEPPVDVALSGADRDVLRRAADAVEQRLARIPGVREIDNAARGGKQELRLRIRPEAEAMGLSLGELARQVRQGFHGEEVQRVQRGRDDVAVVVRYPLAERRSLRDLHDVWIRVPGGAELPFPAVAEAEIGPGFAAIERRKRKSQISVTAGVDSSVATGPEVLARLRERDLPEVLAAFPGVEYELLGLSREESELTARLARDWLLAMLAAYALLAIPLRSYAQPLLVLGAVPFGLVGALVGHVALGLTFSSFSLIGLLALTGVVINDALVLIDRANQQRAEGAGDEDALVEAGVTRFRAIVLTSLTTFFGLLPLLFERSAQAQWLKPMAVTLGFGVLFATLITLLLVPVADAALGDLRRLCGRAVRHAARWTGRLELPLPESQRDVRT